MRDESKDNAPNWESAKGGLATFVDQVEDKHLVQVEDHPTQMIQSKLNLPFNLWNILEEQPIAISKSNTFNNHWPKSKPGDNNQWKN